jgi:hypothetical protein
MCGKVAPNVIVVRVLMTCANLEFNFFSFVMIYPNIHKMID